MYEAPKLELYGTFRELTQGGGKVETDLFEGDGGDGCIVRLSPSVIVCTTP